MRMKRMIMILSLLLPILILSDCGQAAGNGPTPGEGLETPERIPPQQTEEEEQPMESEGIALNMTIGNDVFPVKLYENQTARALVDLLPMTVEMDELNGNEKFYYLPGKLPTDPEQLGQIRAGDIMLYGDDCLVLFYEGFSTSYRYTRLGYVEDTEGLARSVGDGTVTVVLERTKAE
jgi:hypothetical protein